MKLLKGQRRKIVQVLANSGYPLTPSQIVERDSEIFEAGIYVALARLRADGLLTSTKDQSTEGTRGSPHRRYELSGFGRRFLQISDEVDAGIHSDIIGALR